jgi:hypothetical protein
MYLLGILERGASAFFLLTARHSIENFSAAASANAVGNTHGEENRTARHRRSTLLKPQAGSFLITEMRISSGFSQKGAFQG